MLACTRRDARLFREIILDTMTAAAKLGATRGRKYRSKRFRREYSVINLGHVCAGDERGVSAKRGDGVLSTGPGWADISNVLLSMG